MSKFIILFAVFCLAACAQAGIIGTHTVIHEPVLAKVGTVVHSSPSAVSHQSFTQVHSKSVVEPVLAPIVKTSVHSVPAIHTVHHALPAVHTVHHSVPAVHTVHTAPLAYTLHH